jgi:MFS family permease
MGSKTHYSIILHLSLIGFFAIFSTTIAKNPVLPLYVSVLGGGDAVIGLISSVSPFAGILLSFPVGALSDKVGRKKLLRLSGIVFLAAPLLYLLVSDPLLLIPVRFFHGMATAILGPVMSALIAERFTETKGERIGQYSSATLYGRTLAPLVGGALISYFVFAPDLFRYQSVYLSAFGAGLIVFLLILKLDEPEPHSRQRCKLSDFWMSLTTFMSNIHLRGAAYVDMAVYFIFGAFETFLPLYLLANQIEPFLIGVIFAVQVLSIALTKPFFGRMADRTDPRYQIIGGVLILGVSVGVIPLFQTFFPVLIISLLSGLGMSLSTVATTKYVADIAEKEDIGASMGALSSIMDIGHSGGPLLTGVIITYAGYQTGFGFCLVLAFVFALYFFIGSRVRKTTR